MIPARIAALPSLYLLKLAASPEVAWADEPALAGAELVAALAEASAEPAASGAWAETFAFFGAGSDGSEGLFFRMFHWAVT